MKQSRHLANWLKVIFSSHKHGVADDKAIQSAKEKRERKKTRNIKWWSNDKTWRV